MLVYRIEKEKYKNVFPPRGSFHSDGRWHRKGMWVVYSSENIALAKLEALANSGVKIPKKRVLRIFEIQNTAPIIDIKLKDLPSNWTNVPYPGILTGTIKKIIDSGDAVAAMVPSIQSTSERNILLFPDHPQFNKFVKSKGFVDEYFDPRLKA